MRFVGGRSWNDNILSYQGIIFGAEAFTPYIRNTDSLEREQRYFDDRPFGSYEYFGRSKYRLHRRGFIRMASSMRFGTIGGKKSNTFQSVIHRDQTYKSIKVKGWDKQVANGGRFAWNIDHKLDLMLLSRCGDVFNLGCRDGVSRNLNIYTTANLHIGNHISSVGGGIGYTTLDFKNQSGTEDIKLRPGRNSRISFTAEAWYQRIIHDSMIEGFGLFKTFPDDPFDDEPTVSLPYELSGDEVVRDIASISASLNWRVNKATFFYKQIYHTKQHDTIFADNWYGWGTIGFNFLL